MNVWKDQDTEAGYEAYYTQGLNVTEPHEVRQLQPNELRTVATACRTILEQTYKGNYPLPLDMEDAMVESVRSEELQLFLLQRGTQVLAMAGLAKVKGLGGAETVKMWELGRSAEDPASPYSARAFLKYRVPWALEHLPDTDFLVSSTRSPVERPELRSGKGIQSVWWGGRARARQTGDTVPLLTTNVGYDYRLGQLEPFTSFAIPTRPEEWKSAVQKQSVVVPTSDMAHNLYDLFYEATDGQAVPTLRVEDTETQIDIKLHVQSPPGETQVTRYVISDAAAEKTHSLEDVDDQLYSGIGDKVVVEADQTKTTRGAAIMRQLLRSGFSFSGWQPSCTEYGGVAVTFNRPNPALLAEAIAAEHHRQYFDAAGLASTRNFLDNVYHQMHQQLASTCRVGA